MATEKYSLRGKYIISGEIVTQTGMHIGGTKTELTIGGVDNNIIKKHGKTKEPFIPGSSLKGKLRSMLAKVQGSLEVDDDKETIWEIFGYPGNIKKNLEPERTRLFVRDADLDIVKFRKTFPSLIDEGEIQYTEIKTENVIKRISGTAEHPRPMERVPAGSVFILEMIYDDYSDNKTNEHLDKIWLAMKLLTYDYLGGSGSRGYGKISFENVFANYYKIEGNDLVPKKEKQIDKTKYFKIEVSELAK